MRLQPFLFSIMLAFSAAAQQVAQHGTQQGRTTAATQASAPGADNVDPKLHVDVLTLLALSGINQRLQSNFEPIVEMGKKQMMLVCTKCSPEFSEEWARQMREGLKPEDFIQVAVHAYEKYLNDDDVRQLMEALNAKRESRPVHISPELKQKLASVMPSIQGEIMGNSVQIATKLGAEVAQRIEIQHPEYLKANSNSSEK